MSDRLIIALPEQPEQPLHWLVWNTSSHSATAQGELASAATLADLREHAALPCYALLPSSLILMTEVRLPNDSRAARQAIPFQLEEQLADDLDRQHFVVGPAIAAGHYPVAVVARALMDSWLARFQDAGLTLQALLPDTLLLPAPGDSLYGLDWRQQVLIRTKSWAGMAIDSSAFSPWWSQAGNELSLPLHLYRAEDSDGSQVFAADNLDPQPLDRPPLELLASNLTQALSGNLLQGDYRQQNPTGDLLRNWRVPAIILILLFIAQMAGLAWDNQQLKQTKTALDKQISQVLTDTFPDVRRVVNARSQMSQRLRALRSAGQGDALLPLLDKLVLPLQQVQGISLQGINYQGDDGTLRLDLQAPSYERLDQLTQQLQSAGLTVSPGSFKRADNQIRGQLTLKERP